MEPGENLVHRGREKEEATCMTMSCMQSEKRNSRWTVGIGLRACLKLLGLFGSTQGADNAWAVRTAAWACWSVLSGLDFGPNKENQKQYTKIIDTSQ